MKKEILPSILISIACLVLFCVIYPAIIWAIAQIAPNKGEGFMVAANGKNYYENIAQKFTADKYFWSRPSAVDYNAMGSGGSNKGPANPDLLKQVHDRIDTFLVHNPGVKKEDIPVDMVTASGSGLDPDISVQGALVQAARIAKVRGMQESAVKELISKHTDKPLWGMLGPEKVNVLKLNLDLDKVK
jgi:K+-transporting ATPase ATPase C chain